MLSAPGVGAAPVCSLSVFGALPSTVNAPGTTGHLLSPSPSPITQSRDAASLNEGASQSGSLRLSEGEAFALTRPGADLAASPQGLTATAAHNLYRSAGRSASLPTNRLPDSLPAQCPADLHASFAVDAASLTTSPGTTTTASYLAAHSRLPTDAGRWAGGESGGDTITLVGAPA